MRKLIVFCALAALLTSCSCDEYASDYSCSYVKEKASYDVYYWRNVSEGNAEDEKLIGQVKGLVDCKNMAIGHSIQIGEEWSDRSYICVLVEDGRNMEKHRLLNDF